jgi:signal transduction histidine kinase
MVEKQQSVREVFNKRRNGEVFPCLVLASTLRDAHGEPIGYMGISRDITELKKAQTELMSTHNALKEKNEQLQELNASKDKFFSIISHDLRGAFGALLGFAQLISDNIDAYSKDRVKTLVSRLRTCAERLYALLENLLTWSRLQRGVVECVPKVIDLFPIAKENLELFTTRAEQKQITFKNSIQEGTTVYADPVMVNTVMRNLLSNGLKFTSAGGSIHVSSTDHDEHFIAVTVVDTGIGIPEDILPRLLRIDTQYTHTGTAGEQGTGLGLILCKELVEKNGGNLWVESELGKGTIFTFTLPKQPLT